MNNTILFHSIKSPVNGSFIHLPFQLFNHINHRYCPSVLIKQLKYYFYCFRFSYDSHCTNLMHLSCNKKTLTIFATWLHLNTQVMIVNQKSDLLGAAASSLCLIHCMATPFIFVTQACLSSCCESSPLWWNLIDYLFLIISAYMVFRSVQKTTKRWIKYSLWINWFALLFILLNEQLDWVHLIKEAIYFPAISLVLLHLKNSKHNKNNTAECCTNV